MSIISPADDSHFSYGDAIQFQLEVKNNFLEIQSVCRTSNTDSIFGKQFQFNYDRLSPGLGNILVNLILSDCSRIATSITLAIHPRNEKAIVKIIPPQLYSLWDCSRCVSVCPYSHPSNSLHNLVRFGIKQPALFRLAAIKPDDFFYGAGPAPAELPDWISDAIESD